MSESNLGKFKMALSKCGLAIEQFKAASESKEYEAASFVIGKTKVIYRSAKTTPKKQGAFVTLWIRGDDGVIKPFNEHGDFDVVIIACGANQNFSMYVFTKETLKNNGIISSAKSKGKLGFRVYPAWENPESKQALKTQSWQNKCFFELSDNKLDLYMHIKDFL